MCYTRGKYVCSGFLACLLHCYEYTVQNIIVTISYTQEFYLRNMILLKESFTVVYKISPT